MKKIVKDTTVYEFYEYCVPRNHTIVQVLFRTGRIE